MFVSPEGKHNHHRSMALVDSWSKVVDTVTPFHCVVQAKIIEKLVDYGS